MPEHPNLPEFSGVCRLFPLGGVVLLPHVVLPLHIFEPRYRQMLADALEDDGLITLVLTCPDAPRDDRGEPAVSPVGCVGRVIRHEMLPDGRSNLLLQGIARARLDDELEAGSRLYRRARATLLPDVEADPDGPDPRPELLGALRTLLTRRGGRDPGAFLAELQCVAPLGPFTDLLAQALGLPIPHKQRLLAEPASIARADFLLGLIRDATPPAFPPPFSDN